METGIRLVGRIHIDLLRTCTAICRAAASTLFLPAKPSAVNIAELSTAALRCAPADCRVGTLLAVPGRGDASGLTELADPLALAGHEVVVLSGNPKTTQ